MTAAMKLVILDGYTSNPGDLSWAPFDALGDVTRYDRSAPEEVIPRLQGADIALINKVEIDRQTMDACPSLRYIGVMATGVNVVDLKAARDHGIVVTNVPHYSTDSVAQLTFALLLALTNDVAGYNDAVKAGLWTTSPDFTLFLTPQRTLTGLTMGLYGYGSIGRRVGAIGRAFGMNVLAHRRQGTPDTLDPDTGVRYVTFARLLAESDVISLHAPLTADNDGVFNDAAFHAMKRGAYLLNTARGRLINEGALARALSSGHLAGAAVDVAREEPLAPTSPLLTAPHLIMTPHIAYAAVSSRERLLKEVVRNIEAYLNGESRNVVS